MTLLPGTKQSGGRDTNPWERDVYSERIPGSSQGLKTDGTGQRKYGGENYSSKGGKSGRVHLPVR